MDTKADEIILKRLKRMENTVKACQKTLKDIENQCNLMSYVTMARALDNKDSNFKTP